MTLLSRKVQIDYSHKFIREFKKAPRKIQMAFRERLKLFLGDKFHPLLNNHPLKGKYKNCRSINVTGDWRAVFRELDSGKIVYFDALGTHNQLYK
jgi:addiction module RelE/StbE family toxin